MTQSLASSLRRNGQRGASENEHSVMERALKTSVHAGVGFCVLLLAFQIVVSPPAVWWLGHRAAGVLSLAALYGLLSAATEIGFRVERSPWRFVSIRDAFLLLRSTSATALAFLLLCFILNRAELLPRSALLLSWVLQLGILAGARLLRRAIHEGAFPNLFAGLAKGRGGRHSVPLLIVGDINAADSAIRYLERDPDRAYAPSGLVTSDPSDTGKLIRNVPVVGTVKQWDQLTQQLQAAGPHPAMLFLDAPHLFLTEDQLGALAARNVTPLRLPKLTGISSTSADPEFAGIQEVSIEELLSRPPRSLDLGHVRALIEGRRVLVTGAGGSIGSELCRQIASLDCAHLTMLDHSEFLLFQIDREIAESFPGLSRAEVLCNVRDRDRLHQWFQDEQPQVVFHAAALKHVPLVETHPDQGFLTNVVGTSNVVEAAESCRAADFVLISTDKAVAPSNVMGATKRLAESVVRRDSSHTRFTVVRFGNVLGSAGSVVPIFTDQIARGGPVTVTHQDVERYFMTIPEAVQLVLHAVATRTRSTARSKRLSTYVLDMGKPVKIYDLAKRMIILSGKTPGTDIKIEITGLRMGEKLTEALVDEDETVVAEGAGVIEIESSSNKRGLTRDEILLMERAASRGDRERIATLIRKMISSLRSDDEWTTQTREA